MIRGDVNAHSILWDDTRANKEPDQRGITLENWLAENNMLAVNDGRPTHDSRSSGTASAPDVTFVHTSMMDRVSWETVSDLSSDHRPIIITSLLKSQLQTNIQVEVEQSRLDEVQRRCG